MSPVLEMPQGPAPQERKATSLKKASIIILCAILLSLGLGVFFMLQGRIISTENSISAVLVPVPSPLSVSYTEVFAAHGTLVSQGMPLARLDISGYALHLPHAQALVRGAVNSAIPASALAQNAQQNEAEMVTAIALARQEEQAKHTLMEKRSVAHARALLQLRGQQGDNAQRGMAQKQEHVARQQLEQAKAAYELASRNRSAVESVLHEIRAQRRAQGGAQGHAMANSTMGTKNITDQLTAPTEGYIVGDIPTAGQIFQMGQPVFMILPSQGTQLKAIVHMPQDQARALNMTMPVYMQTKEIVLRGTLQQVVHDTPISVVSILLDAQGKDFDALMLATQEKKARIVFWPQPWAEKYLPESVLALLSYV